MTFVEADCSGRATGGVLSQEDQDGKRYAVAFHSSRLTATEYNYPIHDKEMLAIIRCLEAWRAELKGVGKFTVASDHKNLKYFMTRKKLTERQSRWAEFLSEFDFTLLFRPGAESLVPDALSRRDQDRPQGDGDDREQGRYLQLIPSSAISPARIRRSGAEEGIPDMVVFESDKELQGLWDEAVIKDQQFREAYLTVKKQGRNFPTHLKLEVQASECAIDAANRLTFRGRIWVPGGGENDESVLRTRIIQGEHDAVTAGHPGRDGTLAMVSRRFFWPGLTQQVRRATRNCDICGRGHIWRQMKRGLLKPLPLATRPRCDLAMDFITDLPPTGETGARYLWVIVDRFTKAVTLEVMTTMEAEACAERFLNCHFRFHGMPNSIVSDRGSNWTSHFWTSFCRLAGIEQRLSTAYHPQTDGASERTNQEIQAFLRAFVNYAQDDWGRLLPATQLALNNRDTVTTGMSPFFLEHGFHITPFQVKEDRTGEKEKPSTHKEKAERFLKRLQEVTAFAHTTLAASQQRAEESANKRRAPAERFEVGDKVWLHVGNYKSPRPSKKLDALHHKYTVTKVVDSHVMELDVPGRIHPRFHVDLLRRAASDPLVGQQSDDFQPPPIQTEDGEEWKVEEILCARWKTRGRGRVREALVKWLGWSSPTWEPVSTLNELEALDDFEQKYGPVGENDGPLEEFLHEKRRKKEAIVKRAYAVQNPHSCENMRNEGLKEEEEG